MIILECFDARDHALRNIMPGQFIPECEVDGSYKKTQCHGKTI